MTFWTDDKINQLIELKDKHSAARVADILGTTKNSVLGKIHRMGLKKPPAAKKSIKRKTPQLPPRPNRNGVQLSDLTAKQCRFPHGDAQDGDLSFCGADIHKKSYCKEHYDLCHVKISEYEHRDKKLYGV
jgi:GcrA cell cycle regulator